MPAGISASDKKILIAGGTLLFFMVTALALLSPPSDTEQVPVPSTYSTRSGGAAAAYRLLLALHYPVRRWADPPTELVKEPGNILLVLAEPLQPPSEQERKALSDFVIAGGHVLFTGGQLRDYFADADLSPEPPDPKFVTYGPALPSAVMRGAKRVTLQPRARWRKLHAEQLALYGADDAAGVVCWSRGAGQILWWAGSTPLTNSGITRDDNLRFFLNSVANWEPEDPYHIYWDEYFHGQRSSLWSYVGRTSLAWSVPQIGLLVLAVLFTFARRSGPSFVPPESSRLWPLEFVDTLGGLYERARAGSAAVDVSYGRLKTLLGRQLGMPAGARDSELAAAAEERLGWKDSGLAVLLARSAVARNEHRYAAGDALKIVQQLENMSKRLDARS
jgi:hypothetical protein